MGYLKRSLGFIGAGKLAGSVIRGLILRNFCAPEQIIASEPSAELRELVQRETGIHVTADNLEAARAREHDSHRREAGRRAARHSRNRLRARR